MKLIRDGKGRFIPKESMLTAWLPQLLDWRSWDPQRQIADALELLAKHCEKQAQHRFRIAISALDEGACHEWCRQQTVAADKWMVRATKLRAVAVELWA